MPFGSAIHPSRREAIPVIRKATPYRWRRSAARSRRSRASVRLTLPNPRKQRLNVRIAKSSRRQVSKFQRFKDRRPTLEGLNLHTLRL